VPLSAHGMGARIEKESRIGLENGADGTNLQGNPKQLSNFQFRYETSAGFVPSISTSPRINTLRAAGWWLPPDSPGRRRLR
jgi:hypothetical protein